MVKLTPTKPQDPSIPTNRICHFFRIPPELRLPIYDLAFQDFTIDLTKYYRGERQCPPLMCTNKLFRKESLKAWLRRIEAYRIQGRKQYRVACGEYTQGLDRIEREYRSRASSLSPGAHGLREAVKELSAIQSKRERDFAKVMGVLEIEKDKIVREMAGVIREVHWYRY